MFCFVLNWVVYIVFAACLFVGVYVCLVLDVTIVVFGLVLFPNCLF